MSSESSRIDILRDNILASFWMIETFDKRRREYKKLGWIYAARNPSFVDPVFKVGVSSRPPLARMQELSASTSVYRGFDLAYFVHVTPRDIAEKWAHETLKEFRINPRKEFFQAPLPAVVKALDRVAEMLPVPLGKTRAQAIWNNPCNRVRCRVLIVVWKTGFPVFWCKSGSLAGRARARS